MGFYSRTIFPRLCELALNTPVVAQRRQELLTKAGGEILEIGFGTGSNLPHYPAHVRKLTIVDPNPGMHRRALARIESSGMQVDRRLIGGERLPFDEGAFDCVVSTFTLCSIEDVGQALAEAHRVLRPGGQFLFLEHGLSPDAKVQKWQRRLNWLQRRLADNCRLDRPVRQLVSDQKFARVEAAESYLERMPRTHGYIYEGVAVK